MHASDMHKQILLTTHYTRSVKSRYLTLDPIWERCSCDHTTNAQGSAMLGIMNSMHIVAMNESIK
eukprot:c40666_g1_i1 orf=3-194(-)